MDLERAASDVHNAKFWHACDGSREPPTWGSHDGRLILLGPPRELGRTVNPRERPPLERDALDHQETHDVHKAKFWHTLGDASLDEPQLETWLKSLKKNPYVQSSSGIWYHCK